MHGWYMYQPSLPWYMYSLARLMSYIFNTKSIQSYSLNALVDCGLCITSNPKENIQLSFVFLLLRCYKSVFFVCLHCLQSKLISVVYLYRNHLSCIPITSTAFHKNWPFLVTFYKLTCLKSTEPSRQYFSWLTLST